MTDFPEMNRFPLKLNKEMVKDSIFIKQKMTEKCHTGKLLGVVKREEGLPIDWNSGKYKNDTALFKDYYKLYDEEVYHTSYYLSKHKYGRCYPKDYLSLSTMRRIFRHSFCKGIYIDIDMRNAHPVILSSILLQNNFECEKLTYYADNPTEIRKEVMDFYNITKDEAKELLLTICYGGGYTHWCQNKGTDQVLPFLCDLEKEMKHIQAHIHTANLDTIVKEYKKENTKWDSIDKERRGTTSLYAQSVERLIQEKAISWLIQNKGFTLNEIVPSQDGFMILKELWYDDLTDDINTIIHTQLGIEIEFIIKPFDEAIEIEEWAGKSFKQWIDDLSSKRIADRFISEFNNNICMFKQKKSFDLYVFNKSRWIDETDESNRHTIIKLLSEELYEIIKSEIDADCGLTPIQIFKLSNILRTITSTKSNLSNFYLHLLANVRRIPEDFNSNQFVIGFENGIYDLIKSEFRPYTYEDYVTLSTGYNYAECDPNKKKVLMNIFNEIIDDNEKRGAFLRILASGLDGLNYQNLILFNGTGRNGKGFTSRLMAIALGNYFYQASNEIIKDSVKAGSASPLLYNLKNKRYVVFPEVEGIIKNALCKLLTGGDKVNARLLNKNPEEFSLNGTFVLEFNKPPEMEQKCGHSERERIVDLDFPFNFTSDEDEIAKGEKFKRGNAEYTKDDWIKNHRLEMLHILLDVYREHKKETGGIDYKIPKSLRQRTDAFIANQNPFIKIINQYYTINKNVIEVPAVKKSGLGFSKIWNRIKMTDDYKNMTSRQKKEYSRDELYAYLKKEYVCYTSPQDISTVYNLSEINEYEEPDDI